MRERHYPLTNMKTDTIHYDKMAVLIHKTKINTCMADIDQGRLAQLFSNQTFFPIKHNFVLN